MLEFPYLVRATSVYYKWCQKHLVNIHHVIDVRSFYLEWWLISRSFSFPTPLVLAQRDSPPLWETPKTRSFHICAQFVQLPAFCFIRYSWKIWCMSWKIHNEKMEKLSLQGPFFQGYLSRNLSIPEMANFRKNHYEQSGKWSEMGCTSSRFLYIFWSNASNSRAAQILP